MKRRRLLAGGEQSHSNDKPSLEGQDNETTTNFGNINGHLAKNYIT